MIDRRRATKYPSVKNKLKRYDIDIEFYNIVISKVIGLSNFDYVIMFTLMDISKNANRKYFLLRKRYNRCGIGYYENVTVLKYVNTMYREIERFKKISNVCYSIQDTIETINHIKKKYNTHLKRSKVW